jgi:L-aspartate semialdehyde sulfurtransferase ferredoxin
MSAKVTIDKKKCIQCGGCVGVCPQNALELMEWGIERNDKCNGCLICKKFCPFEAIQ